MVCLCMCFKIKYCIAQELFTLQDDNLYIKLYVYKIFFYLANEFCDISHK